MYVLQKIPLNFTFDSLLSFSTYISIQTYVCSTQYIKTCMQKPLVKTIKSKTADHGRHL